MSRNPKETSKIKKVDETEAQKKAFISAVNVSANFLVTRYPYLCAVLLMVSMPHEIKDETKELPNFLTVYVLLGFYFVVGTVMSFDLFGLKQLSALLMAINSVVTAYVEYGYSNKEIITARLVFRNFATMGCYLMIAGGLEVDDEDDDEEYEDETNPRLLKFGRQIIGTYIVLLGIFIIYDKSEFSVHANLLPGGILATWLLIISYILCGVFIDYGFLVVNCSKYIMFLIFLVTLIVDVNNDIWVNEAGIHSWKMYTIAAQHIPLVSVLMMIREGCY